MKLVRFGAPGAEKPGALGPDGSIRDLSAAVPDYAGDGISLDAVARLRALELTAFPVVPAGTRLGPVVARTGHFVAVGLNYADHAAETGAAIPREPVLFSKAPNCLAGPNDDLVMPPGATKLDWEVELAVVIGRRLYNATEAEALAAVAGYALCNDVSERAWQTEGTGQWLKGKSGPGFGPLGPWLVTPDEIADPQALDLFLDVNGRRAQTGNTRTMIFSVAHCLAFISRFWVLDPGDVVTTGTPPGVGMGMKPPRFLNVGDTMRLGVAGLGEQTIRVVAA
jgi:2-keto-4-pentenoate hydratase/2-oxohepta-3-ene-1,7-dioic acid hydratase in catechol pathway